ncbi:unnamed protein product [Calypogeia fissa]
MGKPAKKSTKKFERKHLDAGLKHRKKLKPMVNALKRKRAAFNAHAVEDAEAAAEENQQKQQVQTKGKRRQVTSEVSQHKEQLGTLKEKDPEFYEFLKEHDKDLLDFNDEDEADEEDEDDGMGLGSDDEKSEGTTKMDGKPETLTSALVDEWCLALREKQNIGSLRNFLQAYRTACHYGDGKDEDTSRSFKYICRSSHVFNKIMMFGLCEVDGVFRQLLGLTRREEVTEKHNGFSAADLQKNKKWKKTEPFVKAYLGNSLNILNQMTDNEMIAFTLRRLKVSVPFLGPFPKLARRFLKVALHFLCSGDGILPVISFFFVREMALKLGEDVVDAVLKGVYREFAATARFVNSTTLPQIQFRANCVVELYGIDLRASYQLAFVLIQQMAIVLRNAITMKTKTAFKSVYCWQYMNCLHLWVRVICTYPGEDGLRRLLYPLVQIIEGVAQLVPTVRYFALRLQCVKMLNELAVATGVFTPVTPLLLDMLHCKELHMSPTGGAGKAIDFDTTLKIPKPAIKTRELQEGYVAAVLDQLANHLAHWSYSVAFPELATIPLVHLRQILKTMKVDRFARKVKQLIAQIELNMQFVWSKRERANFALEDSKAVAAFLQTEKEAGSSPLSQYVVKLKEQADHQRHIRVREDKEPKEDTAPPQEDIRELDKDDDEDVVEDLFVSFDGKK